jgi:hypothetical protein
MIPGRVESAPAALTRLWFYDAGDESALSAAPRFVRGRGQKNVDFRAVKITIKECRQ